jgi:carbamoyltransferase
MITVGISKAQHDASLCILENETVKLFTQIERLNREKHSSKLSKELILCLKNNVKKIDHLILCNIINEKHFIEELIKNNIIIDNIYIDNINHHLFHAASAFYTSGFEEAICLVIDGWGSNFQIEDTLLYETTSIFKASYPNNFVPIYKNLNYDPDRFKKINKTKLKNENKFHLNISHRIDIGVMYGTISRFLNFSYLDAGKTMGLCSYGEIDETLPNILLENNLTNMNLFKNDRSLDTECYPQLKNLNFKQKANLAFAVQKALEKIFLNLIKYIYNIYGNTNVVISGGCALNILGNSVIKEKYPNLNLFVDPIASDACQSLGAALNLYYGLTKSKKPFKINTMFLGPSYDIKDITKTIKKYINDRL